MLKTYRGSCHCGAVRFEADIDLNHHFFCKHCGVRAFGVGNETPLGKMYGINLGCLEDVSEEELARAAVTYVDDRNDKWQSAPEFFSHL